MQRASHGLRPLSADRRAFHGPCDVRCYIASMPMVAVLALLTACLLWGVSFVATKVALATLPPLVVVGARLSLAALCFAVWLAARRQRLGLRGWWGRMWLLSLCGASLHYGLQTVGLQYTSASAGSVYAVTGPVTIAILGAVFLRERLGARKVLGIGVALIGVLTVIGLDALRSFDLGGRLWGDLLVLLSIALWGVFTVVGKRATDHFGALTTTAVMTLLGAVTMLPAAAYEAADRGVSSDVAAWLAVAFLGIGCSFLATLLYMVALHRSEAAKVGVFLYTIPPITALVAWPMLGEVPGLRFVLGAGLVIAGVVLTERA